MNEPEPPPICDNCQSVVGGWWDLFIGDGGDQHWIWITCPVCRPTE